MHWNPQQKIFTQFSYMYDQMKLGYFGMVNSTKTNSLFIFGGYDLHNNNYLNHILTFNLNTKQWTKLPVSLPNKMGGIACTMVVNNTCVLLFGGWNWGDRTFYDNIYIYFVKHQTLKQSKMKCPSNVYSKGKNSCVTITNLIEALNSITTV